MRLRHRSKSLRLFSKYWTKPLRLLSILFVFFCGVWFFFLSSPFTSFFHCGALYMWLFMFMYHRIIHAKWQVGVGTNECTCAQCSQELTLSIITDISCWPSLGRRHKYIHALPADSSGLAAYLCFLQNSPTTYLSRSRLMVKHWGQREVVLQFQLLLWWLVNSMPRVCKCSQFLWLSLPHQ